MIEPIELHALVDGELSAERAREIKQALESDAASRREVDAIVALKSHVAQRHIRHECQAEWKACVGRLNEIDKSRRVENVVSRYAWALCGAFFTFIVVGGIAQRGLSGSRVKSEDIVQVATTLIPTRSPSTSDSAAVNAYTDALLGRARFVLSPELVRVVGGGRGEINGHDFARVSLRDGRGDLALLVVEGKLEFDGMESGEVAGRPYRLGAVDGTNLVAWDLGRDTALLVGNRPHAELAELAGRLEVH